MHAAGYGLADMRSNVAIAPDTIFHLASSGKQITGLGILMLAEAGKLDLNDPVSRHLPELAGFDPKVTIRRLLHHTSGIRDFYDEEGVEEVMARCERPANADIIRTYVDLGCPMARPGIKPGDEFSYSNSGYDLLGTVIERASGQSYHDFFQDRVFDRLGMKDTFTAPDRRVNDRRRASGYELDDDGNFIDAGENAYDDLVGSGSFFTTVLDLCLYDQALATNALVSAASMREALTSGRTNDGKLTDYGFGWYLRRLRGHAVCRSPGRMDRLLLLHLPLSRSAAQHLHPVEPSQRRHRRRRQRRDCRLPLITPPAYHGHVECQSHLEGWSMRKLIIAIALTAFAGIAGVQAQTYPSRSITLIVPFPPGGSTDVAARIMAERMRPLLGQPVIIENVGGAGGSIAVGRLARATPDGYTIDIGQWDTHVGSIIYPLTYDLQKDFEPIGLVSVNPQLMVAKKALPADDLKGLVAWMKANPDKITFVNQNAAAQVTGILFEQATGQKVQFIPYRGAGPAMTDLVSGQVDLLVVQGAVALPQVRGGTIKAIANLSSQRSASMPDIPTSEESGVPGLYMSGWFGFFAPKATPKDVIAKLNSAMVQALADPTVRTRFADLGLDVASREQQTPEGLAAFQKTEIEKWWPIIKATGVKGE